jgi:hypothetical protein
MAFNACPNDAHTTESDAPLGHAPPPPHLPRTLPAPLFEDHDECFEMAHAPAMNTTILSVQRYALASDRMRVILFDVKGYS